jgi:hypothetical protein
MLDVHPPEHRIGGFRDFTIHLLTITAGLLIAIGLEQSVEALHHRHQRKEAESLIRGEIQDNQKALGERAQELRVELADMSDVLKTLESIQNSQPKKLEMKKLKFSEGPIQDSAWRTASTTGVLSYMDYGEVESFSDAYKEQDQLQAMEQLALNDYLQLAPILQSAGGNVDADQAKEALPYARSAMGHLSGMYYIGIGTLGAYKEALK